MNYLNLSPGSAPLVVKVSEGDIGREINFTLVEDGVPYTIPTGSTITCEILKSDGHGTSIPCTWSGSVVTFETTEQSTIRAGKATAELRIAKGSDDIGTANFIIAVEPRPINADTDQTDSSYSQTGDAGDVWTLGSNGTPSWAPSGLDATTATAGQAPIADGAGGWAWGDVATSGDSVPTEVRQAILALFQNGVYTRDDMSDEVAVIQSWATEITAISVSPTTLRINGMSQETIVATTQPSGGIVTWSSSDESIATVSGGVVTPTGLNGTCAITATCGGKSATCAVIVSGFATLLSIDAVYTQSGVVHSTDSLDSLKSDLAVTANWSDGRSTTVTDYTLQGTLEVGTSTIVVSYGGKTTTFAVTVEEPWDYEWYSTSGTVPPNLVTAVTPTFAPNNEYMEVKLAQGTALDFNHVGSAKISVELATLTGGSYNNSPQFVIMTATRAGAKLFVNTNSNISSSCSGQTAEVYTPLVEEFHKYVLICEPNDCKLYIDGSLMDSGEGRTNDSYIVYTGIGGSTSANAFRLKSLKYKAL